MRAIDLFAGAGGFSEGARMAGVRVVWAAMGFPDDYILPTTKRDAMMMLGNAVCPPVAADILTALKERA